MLLESLKTVLVVGLGNPESMDRDNYVAPRHNLGAYFVYKYFSKYKIQTIKNNLFLAKINNILFVVFFNPSVMNISGEYVKPVFDKYKCDELIVFADDMETDIGKYNLSHGIGSNGHNGIRSINKFMKTKKLFRFRLGVGYPQNLDKKNKDESYRNEISKFVLQRFNKDEWKIINDMCQCLEDKWLDMFLKKYFNVKI